MQNNLNFQKDLSQMTLMERDAMWKQAKKEQFLQLKEEKYMLHKQHERLKIKNAKANFKAECRRLNKNPKKLTTIVSTAIAEQGVWGK